MEDLPQPQPGHQPDPVRFDEPRRARIHERLARIGDGPASMYRDMQRLLGGNELLENPASVLIHFVRELKSSVKDVLLPPGFEKPDENGDAAAVDAILKNLSLPPDHAIGITWKKFKPHEIVHRRSLGRPLRLDEVRADAAEFERMLEMLLDEMERSYAVLYAKVDALLAKEQPGKKDVSKLRNEIPQSGQLLGYFYSKAPVAPWLEPLNKHGIFAEPPPYAGWPALHFLERAAETHADRAAEILGSMPVPESAMHQMQYLQCVAALPLDLQPRLLQRFVEDRPRDPEGYIVRDLVDSVVEIAPVDAGSALDITVRLLALHVPKERTGSLRDLQAGFDVHTYGDVVSDAVPAVITEQPFAAFEAFAALLDRALCDANGDDGGSVWWRASIAPHAQNRFFKPVEHLAEAVRLGAEGAVRAEPKRLPQIVAALQKRRDAFFHRLALHLITISADEGSPLAREAILRREHLQNRDLRREFHLLVSKLFPALGEPDKQRFTEMVLEGPDDAARIRDRDPDYATRYHEDWIKDRLAWIHSDLPAHLLSQYDELVTRHGPYREQDDFSGWITEWVGPQSPLASDELQTMPLDQVRRYLAEWKPAETHFVPTREGLARELQGVVKARAAEFSAEAERFVGVDATYVRSIIAGLEDALKEGAKIDWDRTLRLAEWAVAQPREIPGRDHRGLDNDPHWGWARGAVGSLLQSGFVSKTSAPDRALRERLWRVLEVIMSDPDPAEARDKQLRDPFSTAINSTRGRGIEAVMRYILWVRGGVQRPEGCDAFEDLPEVKVLLDEHLDTSIDPSPAIRAVYGQWLFFLDRLAPAWMEANVGRIFPAGDPALEDAALDAYVLYGQYTGERIRELLDDVFRRAIERLREPNEGATRTEREAPRRLGQQFVLAYLAGDEQLTEDSLLARYFDAADVQRRAEVLAFAVHELKDAENPEAIARRLVELWEARAAIGAPGELAAFGRWVGEERLDPAWRLEKLEEALSRACRLDYEFDLMPTLAKLVGGYPAPVLRAVKLAVQASDHWRLYSYVHGGDLQRVLEAAFAAGPGDVKKEAKAIANMLVMRDFIEFREIADRELPPE